MDNLLTGLATGSSTSMAAAGLILTLIFVLFIIVIGLYVYGSLALMKIAKKTNTEPAWLAWVPIGNMVLLARIAMMHWWPVLLYAPAFLFMILSTIFSMNHYMLGKIFLVWYYITMGLLTVFSTIWNWKMFKRVGRPGVWALIPVILGTVGLIFALIPNPITVITGASIIVIGAILGLILLGIAAWGNAPVPIVKKNTHRK